MARPNNPGNYTTDFSFLGQAGGILGNMVQKYPELKALDQTNRDRAEFKAEAFNGASKILTNIEGDNLAKYAQSVGMEPEQARESIMGMVEELKPKKSESSEAYTKRVVDKVSTFKRAGLDLATLGHMAEKGLLDKEALVDMDRQKLGDSVAGTQAKYEDLGDRATVEDAKKARMSLESMGASRDAFGEQYDALDTAETNMLQKQVRSNMGNIMLLGKDYGDTESVISDLAKDVDMSDPASSKMVYAMANEFMNKRALATKIASGGSSGSTADDKRIISEFYDSAEQALKDLKDEDKRPEGMTPADIVSAEAKIKGELASYKKTLQELIGGKKALASGSAPLEEAEKAGAEAGSKAYIAEEGRFAAGDNTPAELAKQHTDKQGGRSDEFGNVWSPNGELLGHYVNKAGGRVTLEPELAEGSTAQTSDTPRQAGYTEITNETDPSTLVVGTIYTTPQGTLKYLAPGKWQKVK